MSELQTDTIESLVNEFKSQTSNQRLDSAAAIAQALQANAHTENIVGRECLAWINRVDFRFRLRMAMEGTPVCGPLSIYVRQDLPDFSAAPVAPTFWLDQHWEGCVAVLQFCDAKYNERPSALMEVSWEDMARMVAGHIPKVTFEHIDSWRQAMPAYAEKVLPEKPTKERIALESDSPDEPATGDGEVESRNGQVQRSEDEQQRIMDAVVDLFSFRSDLNDGWPGIIVELCIGPWEQSAEERAEIVAHMTHLSGGDDGLIRRFEQCVGLETGTILRWRDEVASTPAPPPSSEVPEESVAPAAVPEAAPAEVVQKKKPAARVTSVRKSEAPRRTSEDRWAEIQKKEEEEKAAEEQDFMERMIEHPKTLSSEEQQRALHMLAQAFREERGSQEMGWSTDSPAELLAGTVYGIEAEYLSWVEAHGIHGDEVLIEDDVTIENIANALLAPDDPLRVVVEPVSVVEEAGTEEDSTAAGDSDNVVVAESDAMGLTHGLSIALDAPVEIVEQPAAEPLQRPALVVPLRRPVHETPRFVELESPVEPAMPANPQLPPPIVPVVKEKVVEEWEKPGPERPRDSVEALVDRFLVQTHEVPRVTADNAPAILQLFNPEYGDPERRMTSSVFEWAQEVRFEYRLQRAMDGDPVDAELHLYARPDLGHITFNDGTHPMFWPTQRRRDTITFLQTCDAKYNNRPAGLQDVTWLQVVEAICENLPQVEIRHIVAWRKEIPDYAALEGDVPDVLLNPVVEVESPEFPAEPPQPQDIPQAPAGSIPIPAAQPVIEHAEPPTTVVAGELQEGEVVTLSSSPLQPETPVVVDPNAPGYETAEEALTQLPRVLNDNRHNVAFCMIWASLEHQGGDVRAKRVALAEGCSVDPDLPVLQEWNCTWIFDGFTAEKGRNKYPIPLRNAYRVLRFSLHTKGDGFSGYLNKVMAIKNSSVTLNRDWGDDGVAAISADDICAPCLVEWRNSRSAPVRSARSAKPAPQPAAPSSERASPEPATDELENELRDSLPKALDDHRFNAAFCVVYAALPSFYDGDGAKQRAALCEVFDVAPATMGDWEKKEVFEHIAGKGTTGKYPLVLQRAITVLAADVCPNKRGSLGGLSKIFGIGQIQVNVKSWGLNAAEVQEDDLLECFEDGWEPQDEKKRKRRRRKKPRRRTPERQTTKITKRIWQDAKAWKALQVLWAALDSCIDSPSDTREARAAIREIFSIDDSPPQHEELGNSMGIGDRPRIGKAVLSDTAMQALVEICRFMDEHGPHARTRLIPAMRTSIPTVKSAETDRVLGHLPNNVLLSDMLEGPVLLDNPVHQNAVLTVWHALPFYNADGAIAQDTFAAAVGLRREEIEQCNTDCIADVFTDQTSKTSGKTYPNQLRQAIITVFYTFSCHTGRSWNTVLSPLFRVTNISVSIANWGSRDALKEQRRHFDLASLSMPMTDETLALEPDVIEEVEEDAPLTLETDERAWKAAQILWCVLDKLTNDANAAMQLRNVLGIEQNPPYDEALAEALGIHEETIRANNPERWPTVVSQALHEILRFMREAGIHNIAGLCRALGKSNQFIKEIDRQMGFGDPEPDLLLQDDTLQQPLLAGIPATQDSAEQAIAEPGTGNAEDDFELIMNSVETSLDQGHGNRSQLDSVLAEVDVPAATPDASKKDAASQ